MLLSAHTTLHRPHYLGGNADRQPTLPGLSTRRGMGRPGRQERSLAVASSVDDDSVPDWDAEMTLFKKRITKPNQLSTLRRMLAQADTGKVLYCADSLAIVEGLVNDAPVGTELVFANGAKGVLLWRRSDNICFVLVLDAQTTPVSVGDAVECVVKGILQVVDENEGPQTQREFTTFTVPTGPHLVGKVLDYVCRPSTLFTAEASRILSNGRAATTTTPPPPPRSTSHAAIAAMVSGVDGEEDQLWEVPLFNTQLDMKSRQQITEPLVTQIMGVDTLTPLGRGQAQLLTGPPGCLQHDTALDIILGQAGSDVQCVYAAVGKTAEETRRAVELLSQHGALEYTTVVVAPDNTPLGEQYAALAAACSLGEQVRDAGGHCLVVLDDVSAKTRVWEGITVALADLGLKAMELQEGDSAQVEQGGEEALVEYEGMLVSAAAAQRRRFFSSLIQRAAKVDRRLGGGSLTLVMVLLGTPATGQKPSPAATAAAAATKGAAVTPAATVAQYKHLSEAQKQKLLKALEQKQQEKGVRGQEEGEGVMVGNAVRTEVVEEWMSITDGQVVQRRVPTPHNNSSNTTTTDSHGDTDNGQQPSSSSSSTQPPVVYIDPQLSISRVGARAHHPATAHLAPAVRLELAQATDAQRFGGNAATEVMRRTLTRAARTAAALQYVPREATPYEEQVVMLYALQRGFVEQVEPHQVRGALDKLLTTLKQTAPGVLAHIAQTKELMPEDEEELEGALDVLSTLLKTKGLGVESEVTVQVDQGC